MALDPALAWIAEPDRYARQIDALRQRMAERGRLDAWVERGVSLPEIALHRDRFASLLARTVASGEYVLSAVEPRRAYIGGKWRLLYRSALTDTLVLGVVAEVLGQLCAPYLHERVYSYRKGRSALQALGALAEYLRQHRHQRPDPRQRGVYVMRRDVRRYGESIPTDEASSLWSMLETVLARAEAPRAHPLRTLLAASLRPQVRGTDGALATLQLGVPTGSPIQPAVCNLYLTPMDATLGAIAGGCYARFGDDFLFAHPDPTVVREAARQAETHAGRLGLRLHAPAGSAMYFTQPGRVSPVWPEARGVSHIEYLGCRIDFLGRLGLSHSKARDLRRQLRRRIDHTQALSLEDGEPSARIATLCAVVEGALDPRHPTSVRAAPWLRDVVTDRSQLKELDHALALEVARAASGAHGPRALREVPYRALRASGLPSLVVARNRRVRSRKVAQ